VLPSNGSIIAITAKALNAAVFTLGCKLLRDLASLMPSFGDCRHLHAREETKLLSDELTQREWERGKEIV